MTELDKLILESTTDMLLSGSKEPIKEEAPKPRKAKTNFNIHKAPMWFVRYWSVVMAETVEGQLG